MDTLLRRRATGPSSGWRRLLFKISGGQIDPGESPGELHRQRLRTTIRTPLADGHHRVAVLSLKGGVGKTTTAVGLGGTLATQRGDRVIAVDANPDRGTLSERLPEDLRPERTVRDLLNHREQVTRYADVRNYTGQAESRLEFLASEQDPAVSEAFSEADYRVVANIIERFYSICITDCGTGILHSAMDGILDLADRLVIVSPPSVDGARSASATLDWLDAHGHGALAAGSVAVISQVERKSDIDLDELESHFTSRCSRVIRVPVDRHLRQGSPVDLDSMHPRTREAFLELAAAVADGFQGHPAASPAPVPGAAPVYPAESFSAVRDRIVRDSGTPAPPAPAPAPGPVPEPPAAQPPAQWFPQQAPAAPGAATGGVHHPPPPAPAQGPPAMAPAPPQVPEAPAVPGPAADAHQAPPVADPVSEPAEAHDAASAWFSDHPADGSYAASPAGPRPEPAAALAEPVEPQAAPEATAAQAPPAERAQDDGSTEGAAAAPEAPAVHAAPGEPVESIAAAPEVPAEHAESSSVAPEVPAVHAAPGEPVESVAAAPGAPDTSEAAAVPERAPEPVEAHKDAAAPGPGHEPAGASEAAAPEPAQEHEGPAVAAQAPSPEHAQPGEPAESAETAAADSGSADAPEAPGTPEEAAGPAAAHEAPAVPESADDATAVPEPVHEPATADSEAPAWFPDDPADTDRTAAPHTPRSTPSAETPAES